MRTKHIFYSMALVAVLGSCTAEEFNTLEGGKQDLSMRPLLGDIELSVNDQAQTRFGLGEGDAAQPVFVDGDQLGAAIIDKPTYTSSNYNKNNPIAGYEIVEYYSCNNAFTRNNGIWTVDQPMVEGNYLFYAPYNQKMQLRTPLSIKLPVKQDASSEKAALSEFYNSGSVVRIGYQFLAAKDGEPQKPNVTMNDVFAYPLFTIKNNFNGYLVDEAGKAKTYNGAISLDSIQISQVETSGYTANDVICGGELKHADDSKTGATATEGVVGLMKEEGAWATSPMETFTKDLLSTAAVTGCNNESGSTSQSITSDRTKGVITTLDMKGKEIAKGGEYKFYAVLPAMKISDSSNRLRLTLFVKIDGVRYMIEDATVTTDMYGEYNSESNNRKGILLNSATGEINLVKGQKYPQEELNFDGSSLTAKPSKGSILTVDLKGGFGSTSGAPAQIATEIPEAAEIVTIANNDEFIQFFKNQLNGSALAEDGSSVSGTKFAFSENTTAQINSELIEALYTYNNKGSIKINTGLVIANDVKVTDIGSQSGDYTPVTFASANGTVYKIDLKTNVGGYNTTTLGVLQSTKSSNTLSVHVTASSTYTVSAETTVGNLRNDGTVTVEASQTLTPSSFVNNGTLDVSGTVKNTVTNNGTISIAAAAASVTVNAGTGVIEMAAAYAAANVTVLGGTQTGIYSVDDFNETNVKAADAIAWINAIKVTNTAQFNATVISAMKDIKTVYAPSASFVAGTYDMSGKTLALTGSSKTISGAGRTTTTVQNITILNTATVDVTLTDIAATGIYTNATGVTAKILANGTTATWNGGKAE